MANTVLCLGEAGETVFMPRAYGTGMMGLWALLRGFEVVTLSRFQDYVGDVKG